MKRRDLTLLSFKKVSYKAWINLALTWKRSRSSLMPLAESLTTAGMQRHSSTSWWPVECWVSSPQPIGNNLVGNLINIRRFGRPAVAAPMWEDHEQLLPLTTCFLSCSPGWDSIRRHDPHRILPLHGTRRPGDDASICSGNRGGFLPPLHDFSQTRILTILLALWSGHQLVSLNKLMTWGSDVSLLNNLLINHRLVYCWKG